MRVKKLQLLIMLGGVLLSGHSYSFSVMDYLRGYKLGVNFIGQSEGASINFDVDTTKDPVSNTVTNCGENTFEQIRNCSVQMNGGGGRGLGASFLHGFGLYLQQPFKKQGEFYFNWDLGIGIQAISAGWENEQGSYDYQGLKSISYSLYGAQLKPYVQIGWTPYRFPDVIFTLGPVIQMVAGSVSVNDQEETAAFIQSSNINSSVLPWAQAYFELELVFLRFGNGAFSWYISRAAASSSVEVGDFYAEEVGAMSNFSATFRAHESGFKLLLNWP